MNTGLSHLCHNGAITLQTQHRRKILFGCGETERAAADVISPGCIVHLYIVECIGGASYDKFFSQYIPGLGYGHVFFPQMYAIGMDFLD